MKSFKKNDHIFIPLEVTTDIDAEDFSNDEEAFLIKKTDDFLFENISRKKQNKALMLFKELYQLKLFKKYIKKEIKPGIVFILLIIITCVIAIQPEAIEEFRQYSVFKDYSPSINQSFDSLTSVIRVKIRGPLLYSFEPTMYTNISVVITNMECNNQCNTTAVSSSCNCQFIWTVPILYSEVLRGKETVQIKNFYINERYMNGDINVKLQTSSHFPVSIGLNYVLLSKTVENQVIYAAVILLSVYVLIIFDIVHRSLAAILGSLSTMATLSALNLKPSLQKVISWLDFDTLCLLFGMMLIVGVFSETGFFDWIALMAFKIAKGKPWLLLIILCTVSAVVSAFLDNVTTVLLLTPVSIRLSEALKMDPKKVLIAEILFSNIGGTATAIGDPPNVILVSSEALKNKGLTFTNFTLHMSIGTVFITILCLLFMRFLYRDLSNTVRDDESYRIVELKREIEIWRRSAISITIASQEEATVRALLLEKVANLEHELNKQTHARHQSVHCYETLKDMEEKYGIKDKVLLVKCSFVLVLVIVCFFISSLITGFHLDLGWIAFLGAIWVLILSDFGNLEAILDKVEWATLIFFAGLFAMMHGLEELNLISWIGEQVSKMILTVPTEYRLLITLIVILWLSALSSSFIDNIPFTTAMIPVIIELSKHLEILPLIWALAFGACLGGNGTMIGASANVVVAGIAQQHGYSFTFIDFFKVGFPMMLFSTFLAMIYIIICHIAIGWNYS